MIGVKRVEPPPLIETEGPSGPEVSLVFIDPSEHHRNQEENTMSEIQFDLIMKEIRTGTTEVHQAQVASFYNVSRKSAQLLREANMLLLLAAECMDDE